MTRESDQRSGCAPYTALILYSSSLPHCLAHGSSINCYSLTTVSNPTNLSRCLKARSAPSRCDSGSLNTTTPS